MIEAVGIAVFIALCLGFTLLIAWVSSHIAYRWYAWRERSK